MRTSELLVRAVYLCHIDKMLFDAGSRALDALPMFEQLFGLFAQSGSNRGMNIRATRRVCPPKRSHDRVRLFSHPKTLAHVHTYSNPPTSHIRARINVAHMLTLLSLWFRFLFFGCFRERPLYLYNMVMPLNSSRF